MKKVEIDGSVALRIVNRLRRDRRRLEENFWRRIDFRAEHPESTNAMLRDRIISNLAESIELAEKDINALLEAWLAAKRSSDLKPERRFSTRQA